MQVGREHLPYNPGTEREGTNNRGDHERHPPMAGLRCRVEHPCVEHRHEASDRGERAGEPFASPTAPVCGIAHPMRKPGPCDDGQEPQQHERDHEVHITHHGPAQPRRERRPRARRTAVHRPADGGQREEQRHHGRQEPPRPLPRSLGRQREVSRKKMTDLVQPEIADHVSHDGHFTQRHLQLQRLVDEFVPDLPARLLHLALSRVLTTSPRRRLRGDERNPVDVGPAVGQAAVSLGRHHRHAQRRGWCREHLRDDLEKRCFILYDVPVQRGRSILG